MAIFSLVFTRFSQLVFCLGVTLAALIETAHRRREEALCETPAMNSELERLVADRMQ